MNNTNWIDEEREYVAMKYRSEIYRLLKYIKTQERAIAQVGKRNAKRVGRGTNIGYALELKQLNQKIAYSKARIKVVKLHQVISPDKYMGGL